VACSVFGCDGPVASVEAKPKESPLVPLQGLDGLHSLSTSVIVSEISQHHVVVPPASTHLKAGLGLANIVVLRCMFSPNGLSY